MSLAHVWKDFDMDCDGTVFRPVPCRSAAAVLAEGFTAQDDGLGPSSPRSRAIVFWEIPDERRHAAYFVLPSRLIVEAEKSGCWQVTYSVDPRGPAYYALSPRMGSSEAPAKFEADGSIVFLPEGCDAGIPQGLVEEGDHAHYSFTSRVGDLASGTAEAVRTVVAHTRRRCYRELRTMLRGSNEALLKNFARLAEYLPVELRNMRGLPQLPGHYGLDPLAHTLEALRECGRSATLMERFHGEWAVCREWVRCAILFHDLGKKVNPFNMRHAKLSGKMARFHLRSMGYGDREEKVIVRLVETHDVLGGIKRGRLTPEEGARLLCDGMEELIPLDRLVDMHYEVASADIRSIGYLHHVSVQDEYAAMRTAIGTIGGAPKP